MRGLRKIARAISIFCRCGRSRSRTSSREVDAGEPELIEMRRDRSRALPPAQHGRAADRRVGQQHVLERPSGRGPGSSPGRRSGCRGACASRGPSRRTPRAGDAESRRQSGCDQAGEQLDHGRLAGAVLAEQRVHLAGGDREATRRRRATVAPKALRRRRRRATAGAAVARPCPHADAGEVDRAGEPPLRAGPAPRRFSSSVLRLADQRRLQADLRRLRRVDRGEPARIR